MSFSPALSKQAQVAIFLLKIKKNPIIHSCFSAIVILLDLLKNS